MKKQLLLVEFAIFRKRNPPWALILSVIQIVRFLCLSELLLKFPIWISVWSQFRLRKRRRKRFAISFWNIISIKRLIVLLASLSSRRVEAAELGSNLITEWLTLCRMKTLNEYWGKSKLCGYWKRWTVPKKLIYWIDWEKLLSDVGFMKLKNRVQESI